MNRFLGPESKFYEVLSLFADLVIVNVLLVVSSFPIFTAGMSLRTAHDVIGDMVREEGTSRGRTFLRRLLVRPGINSAWWLIVLAVGALAAYELGTAGLVLRAGLLSGLIVLAGITVWFFHLDPQLADAPFAHRLAAAATSAVRFLPRTLLALVPWALLLGFPFFVPSAWGGWLFFVVAVGPALAIYLGELALQ